MKKTISVILILCMLLSLLPVLTAAKGIAISHVDLTGLAEPKNSLYPGFTLIMPEDAHYKLDTSEGINGIEWRDVTAGKDLTTTDKFVNAHEYRVTIHLVADYDYYFYRYSNESYVLTTVNGTTCNTSYPYSGSGYERYIDVYYFPEVVGAEKLKGSVYLASDPKASEVVSFYREGAIAYVPLAKLKVQWQRRGASASEPFEDIVGANNMTYTPTGADVGKYLRVKVGAEGYYNNLFSESKRVVKADNNADPVTPSFYVDGDQLYLTGEVGQQYVVTMNKRAVTDGNYDLSEGDWTWSYHINYSYDRRLNITLAGELNKPIYVYTRYMETDEKNAGTKVVFAEYMFKENYRLTGLFVSCQTPESSLIEGGVAKFRVDPIPENATDFKGIIGQNWSVDGSYTGSEYAKLFANPECTIPLNGSSYYKTVYVKLLKAKNGLQVAAQTQVGYTDYLRDYVTVNVRASNGLYNLSGINCDDLIVYKGTYLDFYPIYPYPYPANMSYITIYSNNGSNAPKVAFYEGEEDGITVDATNTDPGTYYYGFSNGSYSVGSFKVIVVDSFPAILKGDCNDDGFVDNKDVVTLFRYVSGNVKAEDETVYDYDDDGVANNKDVVALFRYVSTNSGPKG